MPELKERLPIPHLEERKLYALWKYANAPRLIPRNKLRFEDFLTIQQDDISTCAFDVGMQFNLWGIELQGLVFHQDLYISYDPGNAADIAGYKDNPATIKRSLFSIYTNKFSWQDFLDSMLMFKKFALGEWFEFDPPSGKNKKRLDDLLNTYLDGFIEDKLQITKINWYKFDKQKQELLDDLRPLYQKFGDTFVLKGKYYTSGMKTPSPSDDTKIWFFNEFLPLHTLIALEKLGYLVVEEVWVIDGDVPPEEDDVDSFKIRLTLLDKAIEEIEARYKPRPTNAPSAKSHPTSFDAQTSRLLFQTHEATISRTRNSNPHYLLEVLMKKPTKTWSIDELWEKLGKGDDYDGKDYDPEEDWKKIYNTAYDLNEKIAKETKIKDFIVITKTSLSVNKKYLS